MVKIKKKCAICGYEYEYDNTFKVNFFLRPHGEGAQYYFDLWHFNIELCPNCDYASRDVSSCSNDSIIEDEKYQTISSNKIIKDLYSARPNKIDIYIKAGMYYASIGDFINSLKCKMQAGDLVYNEIMYWQEYILDSDTPLSIVHTATKINNFRKFANNLTSSALLKLEEICMNNKTNIDNWLLLAGVYSTGNKIQKIKCAKILNDLQSKNLLPSQSKAIEFLLSDLY